MVNPNVQIQERLSRLEGLVGAVSDSDQVSLTEKCSGLGEDLTHVRGLLESHLRQTDDDYDQVVVKIDRLADEYQSYVEKIESQMNKLVEDIAILRRAVTGTSLGGTDGHSKLKIPEPKPFVGSQSAKELENFMKMSEDFMVASRQAKNESAQLGDQHLGWLNCLRIGVKWDIRILGW
ncbi:hypothetical protein POM88_032249 [Heracleum sosnowskyi]|uniref:Uncharacterized protein n=1 Tax=Heracleum sosnowskyi TaxID=360622 RepID=A0AAD8HZ90_9APIA|nr:hypothetical protein POM88_032249 [Heracleum sosnowskyi]